jgi:PleD family two-component response regulator
VNGKTINCQSAIGITVVREGDTVNSLVDRADQYMYEAKKIEGKQIVTDFSTGKTE